MTEPLWEGDIFAGKYKVDGVIGQGAMGMVIAAHHLGLDERVAIKVLLPQMLDMPGMVDRFIREARAAARIRGEHVVRVSDVDTLPNGVPFMVMERLEGMDVAEFCRARGPLPVGEAARYVRQVCTALADAHALGVVHRDIKPGNLFLARRRDGSSIIKVLDFGISKLSQGDNIATRAGTVLGSPAYMSPEQMASAKDVDGRTDIWALGVVLFEMLVGELPFQAETLPQLCTAIMHTNPPRPSVKRPDLPADLEAIVMRCLEKDRERRFATAKELSDALARFESDVTRTAVDPIDRAHVAATALSAPGMDSAPGTVRLSSPPAGTMTQQSMSSSAAVVPKRSAVWPIVGAGIAVVTALGIFFATRHSPSANAVQAAAVNAPAVESAALVKPAETAVTPPTVTPSVTAAEIASAAPNATAAATVQPPSAPATNKPVAPANKAAAPAPTVAPKATATASAKDPFQGDRK